MHSTDHTQLWDRMNLMDEWIDSLSNAIRELESAENCNEPVLRDALQLMEVIERVRAEDNGTATTATKPCRFCSRQSQTFNHRCLDHRDAS